MKKYLVRFLVLVVFFGLASVVAFVSQTIKVTVTYKVGEEIVYTQKVNKGSMLGSLYLYESPNHQSYASTWKDVDGVIYETTSVINNDVELLGELKTSLILFTTPENEYTYVNGTNHVHSDGKAVVLSTYYGKAVNIGDGAFYNNSKMKELYLPLGLNKIYSNNFVDCANLTSIYFEGSVEQWNAIENESTIPESISLVFNTAFQI